MLQSTSIGYAYLALILAVLLETIATTFLLRSARGFTRPLPSIATIVVYIVAFFFFATSLTVVPVGIAYAIWSGLGIVLIAAIGVFAFRQRIDATGRLGLAMIIGGVIVINVFSNTIQA